MLAHYQSQSHVPDLLSGMDKKAKKRIDVLQPKLQKLRMQLAGARKQMDDAEEVRKLESEITAIERELKGLKET
jgi:capsule polysaccharide export protein KpsE/RkpR